MMLQKKIENGYHPLLGRTLSHRNWTSGMSKKRFPSCLSRVPTTWKFQSQKVQVWVYAFSSYFLLLDTTDRFWLLLRKSLWRPAWICWCSNQMLPFLFEIYYLPTNICFTCSNTYRLLSGYHFLHLFFFKCASYPRFLCLYWNSR